MLRASQSVSQSVRELLSGVEFRQKEAHPNSDLTLQQKAGATTLELSVSLDHPGMTLEMAAVEVQVQEIIIRRL